MRTIKYNIIAFVFLLGFVSCDDFLDREPLSQVTAQGYFEKADQLESYVMDLYPSFISSHSAWGIGTFNADVNTDNQVKSREASSIWSKGDKLVPNESRSWDFNKIRRVNYFLDRVLPKYKNNSIIGSKINIEQTIGEVYFFRAYEYFDKLKTFGDFPIIKEPLADDRDLLIKSSERAPQNQVARFILEDLDTAIKYLRSGSVDNKNRISKEVAQLLKSRVALYEGTWLKYHKGTAFVPGGPGWPGKEANYPNGYDKEIEFFLNEAMKSAKEVADKVGLTPNSHGTQKKEPLSNPYYLMFADVDMAKYPEVLLWRQYSNSTGIIHTTQVYLRLGTHSGYTRSLVESFLTKKGLPIYAPGSGYKGDNSIEDVTQDRDERLELFMKKPGDIYSDVGEEWDYPKKINLTSSSYRVPTGYSIRKGMYKDGKPMGSAANKSENGCLVFRASEAYLNYIEAQYELNGNLNSDSKKYWGELRKRAGLPNNIDETIAATDLNQERDWAKYSQGQLIDRTLYNIRRERRCEFIAEGMRMDDLRRWRALDQVKNYQVEGLKIWNSDITDMYTDREGRSELRYYPEDENNPNVSNPNLSDYLRPYQIIKKSNRYYDGLTWTLAHYYEPIPAKELQLASQEGKASSSKLYQNPGWPTTAGSPAE